MSKTKIVRCKHCGHGHVCEPVERKPERKIPPLPEPSLPVSDKLRRLLPVMTPSQRFQAIRLENKLCVQCGREPIAEGSKRYGVNCLVKARERIRERKGIKIRRASFSYDLQKAAKRGAAKPAGNAPGAAVAGGDFQKGKKRGKVPA